MLTPASRMQLATATTATSLSLVLALTTANAQGRRTAPPPQNAAQAMPQLFNGPPFSADFVSTSEGSKQPDRAKVYFGSNKMRWDVSDNSSKSGDKPGSMIADFEKQTAFFLDHTKKQAFDASTLGGAATAYMGMLMFFRPIDANQPCLQLQVMAANSAQHHQLSCTRQGRETVNGRSAEKWEYADNTTHESANVWIDNKLRFIIRMRDNSPQHKGGTFDVENISEGPQPASLFEIPPGYTKVDIASMIDMSKLRGLGGGKKGGDSSSSSLGSFLKGQADTAGQSIKDEAKQNAEDAAKKATVEKAKSKIRGLFGRP